MDLAYFSRISKMRGAEMEKSNERRLDIGELYGVFCSATLKELENAIISTDDNEERAFYRQLLNLKLQSEQEKIIGEQSV